MFGRFRGFRDRLKKRGAHVEQELTLENSNLSPAQIATAQKALKILGLEPRRQHLAKQDFIVFLYAMGLNPTDDIIDSKVRAFKLHHKKTFTFGQLAHVWYSMLQDLTDEDEILKRAFQFFDKDGSGDISVQELRTTMHELGDLLSEDEITAFMAIMDVNNDGVIGYTEFLATLKTQAPELAGDNHRLKAAAETDRSVGGGLLRAAAARHYDDGPMDLPPSPSTAHDTLLAAAAALTTSAAASPAATSTGIVGERETASGLGSVEPFGAVGVPATHGAAPAGSSGSNGIPSPRRQASLRAGVVAPAGAEAQALGPDVEGPPVLQRPPSLRSRDVSALVPPVLSSPPQQGGPPQPPPQRAALFRNESRPAESSLVGVGTALAATSGSSSSRLRAPSALEPGPGSDGSGSPASQSGRTPPGSRPGSGRAAVAAAIQ